MKTALEEAVFFCVVGLQMAVEDERHRTPCLCSMLARSKEPSIILKTLCGNRGYLALRGNRNDTLGSGIRYRYFLLKTGVRNPASKS